MNRINRDKQAQKHISIGMNAVTKRIAEGMNIPSLSGYPSDRVETLLYELQARIQAKDHEITTLENKCKQLERELHDFG